MVSENAGPPGAAAGGARDVITGVGGVMVNVSALETRLPLLAVTVADPDCAIRFAVTPAVNCVALTNVVAMAVEFQLTVVLAVKPLPVTVSVKAGPPAVAVDGERLVRVKPWEMVKGSAAGVC